MRAVLDTNVLISGVIATAVPHKLLVKGFEREYQVVVSVETLTEFRETLLKYPERFQMSEYEVQQEVELVRYYSEFVDPQEDITAVERTPATTNSSKRPSPVASTTLSPATDICSASTRSVGSISSNRGHSMIDSTCRE